MNEAEKKISRLISYLVDTYKYKPVPVTLEFGDVREVYRRNLPDWCKIDGDTEIQARNSAHERIRPCCHRRLWSLH